MISTFISLAALVAGAPLVSATAAPANTLANAPVAAPISGPASNAISVPVAGPTVTPSAPVAAAKPLPLVNVRAPQEQAPSDAPAGDAPTPETTQTTTPEVAPEATQRATPAEPIADPTFVSPTEQRAILKAAAGALASVETASGRFSQIDPMGTRANGRFALQRPGRMRFDYDDPVPLLIAADGATVAVRDEELETVDRVPLAATPLNLLLDDKLDFESEAEVMRVIKANGQVAITMRDRTGESDGELTLYLDSASYDLMGWQTLDGNGRLTFVELLDVDTGVSLNPRLFIIEDFEDEDDDDRR